VFILKYLGLLSTDMMKDLIIIWNWKKVMIIKPVLFMPVNIYTRKPKLCICHASEQRLNSYRNIFFSRYWYIGADNGTSTVDIVETWRQNILEPHKPTTNPYNTNIVQCTIHANETQLQYQIVFSMTTGNIYQD
jgi:hypothetical protein